MKKLITSILVGLSFAVSAQETTMINFQSNLTWQQVLDIAAKEKKIVFLEFYTDWCAPCKRLAKDVFTDQKVAELFNQRFINYRIDAEKGEGVALSKKYGVTAFPYMVFSDWNGNMMYSIVGYKSAEELLKDSEMAFKEFEDPKPLGIWDQEYNSNKANIHWLKGYITKRNKLRIDNNQLIDQYYELLEQSDYMNAENLLLITQSRGLNLDSKALKIVMSNFDKIPSEEDSVYHLEGGLIGVLNNAMNKPLLQAIKDTNESLISNVVVPGYSLFPEKIKSMPWYFKQDGDKYKFIYYSQIKDVNKLIPVATEFISRYYMTMNPEQIKQSDSIIYEQSKIQFQKEGMDPTMPMIKEYFSTFTTNDHLDQLLTGAYTVYNNSTDKADLVIAKSWAERAIQLRENANTAEIYAKILHALGKSEEAVKMIQGVIDRTTTSEEKQKLHKIMNFVKGIQSLQENE